MSLSVSELRVIGRSLQRDEVTGQEDRKVFFAAVGLRWAGVIMFLAMLALTIATTILLYSLREAGPLRWKIMGGLIMATVALGYSLFAIRVGAPEGVRLDRKAARQLWKIVDEICRSANAAVPTAIILTDENNAAAATVPRGGLSPHSDMYLVLGLPLLIALAPDQARAVIAHEIGHFSKQHGRTSLEVYKALTMSARIIAYAHGSGNPLMRLLARFYAFAGGRLNRAILRLSRAQEFQADHIAGKVVGNVKAAEALVVLNLADNIIGASDRLLAEERKLIEAGRPAAELEAALALVLARPDPEYSTHPGLAARVAALGQTMYVPAPVGAAHAAEAWLPNLEIYIRDFDEERAKHLGTREKGPRRISRGGRDAIASRTGADANGGQGRRADAHALELFARASWPPLRPSARRPHHQGSRACKRPKSAGDGAQSGLAMGAAQYGHHAH